jgi:cell division protein FtsB
MGSKGLKHPLNRAEPKSGFGAFLERHARTVLGLFVLALFVHDIFGPHGFIAMRRTQNEIEKVEKDLDRLNKENLELGDQVRALKTDPRLIEKIAREDLQRAKPGEIIIRIPPSQQPAPDSHARP